MFTPHVTINGAQVPLAEFAQSINAEVRYGDILVCSAKTLKFPSGVASVGGALVLRGYGHPLPAALTSVGGALVLRGYGHPLPNWIISAGADSRGYWFSAVKQNGAWRIRAESRDFSVADALAHWGSGGQSDKPECLALVEHLVAEIDVRDAVVAEAV